MAPLNTKLWPSYIETFPLYLESPLHIHFKIIEKTLWQLKTKYELNQRKFQLILPPPRVNVKQIHFQLILLLQTSTNSSIMGGGGAKTLPYFNQVEF